MRENKQQQEQKEDQRYNQKPFSIAELHAKAFGKRYLSNFSESDEWDDDDADCFCD